MDRFYINPILDADGAPGLRISNSPDGTWVHRADVSKFEVDNASLQAKIDALMLEYCPEDMTNEQLQEYANSQIAVVCDLRDSQWEDAQNEILKLKALIVAANCPCCNGSGSYHGDHGEQVQCQWCYETKDIRNADE